MNFQDKLWWIKLVSVGTVIFSWVAYIWWKSKNQTADSSVIIIILSVVTFIGLILIFKDKLKNLFPKQEEEVPNAITEKEILKIITQEAEERSNNIKITKPYEWKTTTTVNKNQIYARKVNLNLDNEQFIIILNATHPNSSSPTIYDPYKIIDGKKIEIEKDDEYLEKLMNAKSVSPNKEANIEERIDTDLRTGIESKYKKITHSDEKEKSGDVI